MIIEVHENSFIKTMRYIIVKAKKLKYIVYPKPAPAISFILVHMLNLFLIGTPPQAGHGVAAILLFLLMAYPI